jgi:gamma-glutamyltranspeptidase/glutathione hydrolase
MVASQEALASQVGLTILQDGGNAVDAAVAVGFALAVTLPRAGNLGGGGFMMIYDKKLGKSIALDYRETAPQKSQKNMFLDSKGDAIEDRSKYHGLASGVPGSVDGLIVALKNYGTMPLSKVMAPAIELAESGFKITPDLYTSLNSVSERILVWDSSAAIFFPNNGRSLNIGDTFKQPDLAKTLKLISSKGRDGFYKGDVAKNIVQSIHDAGGVMSTDDLANYKTIIREPVVGSYRGFDIISMPPASSGGIHLIEILNILENFSLETMGQNSADTIHLMAEAMKYAYADRSEYLGDPDFTKIPTHQLLSKSYAKGIAQKIKRSQTTPSIQIKPGLGSYYESDQTTHFSVVDKDGNMVSNTYTLNFSYGSGLVAKGTGVLMNNEMDDFSVKPGTPNAYGLVGGAVYAA